MEKVDRWKCEFLEAPHLEMGVKREGRRTGVRRRDPLRGFYGAGVIHVHVPF